MRDDEHLDREGFIELAELSDALNEFVLSSHTQYNAAYFREEWNRDD